MPEGAEILSAQAQYGSPCIWALVDPKRKPEYRHFSMVGTGSAFDVSDGLGLDVDFVATLQLHNGSFVGHLFELRPKDIEDDHK